MASADAEVSKITANKENSVHSEHHGAAIEANDLASLLCRFEEATSSSDDLSIPSRTPKNIKNILLKAKSAGSSPAPTPPATPPPIEGRVPNHSPSTSLQQTVQGAKSVPVQLKFFINQNGSRSQFITSSSGSKVSSLPIQISTPSGLYHSKSHTSFSRYSGTIPASALPNKSSTKLTILPHHGTSCVGTKMVTHSKPNEKKSNPSKSFMTLPLPLRPTASTPIGKQSPGIEKPSLSLFTPPIGDFSSHQQPVPRVMSAKSPTIIGVKKRTIKPATISLDTYKKRKTLSTNSNLASSKIDTATAKSPSKPPSPFKSRNPSTSKTPTPSLLQAKLESNHQNQLAAASISLLQSMLESKTPNKINSKVTSTQLSANLTKKGCGVKNEVKFANKIKSVPAVPTTAVSSPAVSNPINFQNFITQKVGSQDHDYCFLKISTKEMIQQTVRNIKVEDNLTDLKIETLKDSEYEFTKIEPHEFINFGDKSVEMQKSSDDVPSLVVEKIEEVPDKPEVLEAEGVPEEIPCQIETAVDEVVNAFVFEEGEFLIDEHGNDILATEECPSSEKLGVSGNTVVFKGDKSGIRGRKYRKYHRQAETSSSPVREDSANFFDKIPSHYTALSIPVRPTKTTVFASATRAIGSTDHLELEDRTGHVDDGHFDKVPAHRRCFTNTTKEVEAPEASTPNGVVDNGQPTLTSLSHKHSKVGSRRRKSSEQSDTHVRRSHSRSPSVSRTQDRQSRSMTRRTRTISIESGRSLSSCSTCSSSSYCSTCSGRSWSGSRSRSRSWSNDQKSRSRSRSCGRLSRSSSNESRSRSAGRRRDLEMRSKRTRRLSHSDNRKGHWEKNNRSRSRSKSPTQRSRQRSHHHSGTKSRLAAGGQISQKRKEREEEKVKAMEERRVVYVGKIPEGYTKRQLHKRFESFGDIKEVKVNFREHGDNYGFVTFTYACDAIAAKERGNNIPGERKFDLCFGGRRRFCPDQYADLDGNREIEEEYAPMPTKMTDELDYAALLRQHSSAQRKHR